MIYCQLLSIKVCQTVPQNSLLKLVPKFFTEYGLNQTLHKLILNSFCWIYNKVSLNDPDGELHNILQAACLKTIILRCTEHHAPSSDTPPTPVVSCFISLLFHYLCDRVNFL